MANLPYSFTLRHQPRMNLSLPISVELTASRRGGTNEEQLESFLDAQPDPFATPGDSRNTPPLQTQRPFQRVSILFSIVLFTWLGMRRYTLGSSSDSTTTNLPGNHQVDVGETSSAPSPTLICPEIVPLSPQNPHQDEHREDDLDIMKNTTAFWENFRNQPFDRWASTYTDYKRAMRAWKQGLLEGVLTKTYDNNTPRDIWVYESAVGIGLNLLLMLELWDEVTPVSLNVTVYGNDYVQESVTLSQMIWTGHNRNTIGPHTQAHYGAMCRGDSTSLREWVPAETFDLVYTGYVTPLQDPLKLGWSTDRLDDLYADICKSTDPDKVIQAKTLQRHQEDWFAIWVGEMLRVAKPGGIVAVEMISYPTCQDLEEWGGVAPEWWTSKVTLARYHWPIDPSSIVLELDTGLPGRRYHVRMRKLS